MKKNKRYIRDILLPILVLASGIVYGTVHYTVNNAGDRTKFRYEDSKQYNTEGIRKLGSMDDVIFSKLNDLDASVRRAGVNYLKENYDLAKYGLK